MINNNEFENKKIEHIDDTILQESLTNFQENNDGIYNFIGNIASKFGNISDFVAKVFRNTGKFHNESETYKIGDVVSKDGSLYSCLEDSITGVWDLSKWDLLENSGEDNGSTSAIIQPSESGKLFYYDRTIGKTGEYFELNGMTVVRLDKWNFEFTFDTQKPNNLYSVFFKTQSSDRQYWNGGIYEKTDAGFKLNVSYYIKDYSKDYGRWVTVPLVVYT